MGIIVKMAICYCTMGPRLVVDGEINFKINNKTCKV